MMTTTEILTGIKNWVTGKLTLKQDVINDLASIRQGAQAGATSVQPSDLIAYFNNASYNTSTHRINFYHGQNVVAYIDASPFIVDGMVDDVRIENGYLVVDFNTASGKQDISIPLEDIFNPNNYYTKSETDSHLTQKQSEIDDLYARIGYYVCSTEGNVAAKTIVANNYTLGNGGSIKVKMTNTNTAADATLNINSTGAEPLFYDGVRASANNTWDANEVLEIYYNGTNYQAYNVAGGGDGVFDVSKKYPTSGVEGGNTYTLEGALAVLNANLPASKKKGGMSIKFVHTYDNKYVQYRFTLSTFNAAQFALAENWQGEDKIPTPMSQNIPNSSGVAAKLSTIDISQITFAVSKNVFNTNDPNVLQGYYQAGAKLTANDSFFVTGFIPVLPDETYIFSRPTLRDLAVRFIAYFDDGLNFISYVQNQFNVTIPSGVRFMRLSIAMDYYGQNIQIEKGTTITTFESYSPKIKPEYTEIADNSVTTQKLGDNSVTSDKINDNSVNTQKIKDFTITTQKIQPGGVSSDRIASGTIGIGKVGFIDIGKNLFDKNDPDVLLGHYQTNKYTVNENAAYNLSGYIPVEPNENYVFSVDGVSRGARFVSEFGKSMDIKSTYLTSVNSITVPNDVYFIRVTIDVDWFDKFQIEKGTNVTTYSSYSAKIKQSVLPSIGNIDYAAHSVLGSECVKSLGNMSADGLIELSAYPAFLKKRQNISFFANITTMGTLYIGKGYQFRSGKYIKIDATNITTVSCSLSGVETEGTTSAHGLTIDTFLKVVISVGENGTAKIIVQTLTGENTSITSTHWENAAGNVFVKSTGFVGTDVVLSALHTDIRKPLWIVGDSYLSLGDSGRWPYYTEQLGFTKYLVSAISGGASASSTYNVEPDLEKTLNFGSPRFLVYCLGMNDGSDEDSSTPNATWLSALNSMLQICTERNITPILCTIPCTATKNHEGKNAWIKSSGYRYIDMAKAVNGQSYTSGVNNWYTGYNADGTHPTAIGAQALANQVFVDFPEIMQYD